jgi:hypothetical protein
MDTGEVADIKMVSPTGQSADPVMYRRQLSIPIAQKTVSNHAIDAVLQYLLLNSLQEATSYQRVM